MNGKTKPPVLEIHTRNSAKPDRITQEDLMRLAFLQDAEWLASQAAHKAALQIASRVAHGAFVEIGEMVFDADRKMARRRKAG